MNTIFIVILIKSYVVVFFFVAIFAFVSPRYNLLTMMFFFFFFCFVQDDWLEWMRRFSVELLKESPSPALRSCSALAQK